MDDEISMGQFQGINSLFDRLKKNLDIAQQKFNHG
jgi:hypothetical protein